MPSPLYTPLILCIVFCSADIPCGRPPTEGRLVTPYLQPIPPAGSGFHRYVFSLYTHDHPLSQTTRPAEENDWLKQRTFSTVDFLQAQPDMRPFAFSYYQSQWDGSVREAYSKLLGKDHFISLRTTQRRLATRVIIYHQSYGGIMCVHGDRKEYTNRSISPKLALLYS